MITFPTLYKRSTSGKVSTWYIEVHGDKFRTISGFSDGLKITSDWTICEGKSYNTSEEQALKQAQALHKKKTELGAFENIADIDNSLHFIEPMLAKDFKKVGVDWKYRIFIQPKLDGLRNLNKNNKQFSRTGKEFVCTPHLNQNDITLDGEMYNHLLKNNFNEIISLCRKTKPTLEDIEASEKMVEYWIYDLPECDGVFSKRHEKLLEWFKSNANPNFKLVPTYEVFNEQDINRYHLQFLEDGYEGSMIRVDSSNYQNKRSSSLLKNKDFYDEEFIIKDVVSGIGKLANKAGTFLFEISGSPFNAAINGDHEYLEELWINREQLIGKMATVKYFNLTPDGIPRFGKVISIDRASYE